VVLHQHHTFARGASEPTLADVLAAVERHSELSSTKRRDLASAVRRMAKLLGDEPGHIAVNFPAISEKLQSVVPLAAGMSKKTFGNIRSNFIYAVQVSGLKPVHRWAKKIALAPAWAELITKLPDKRSKIVFSRLGRYASCEGIQPTRVDDHFVSSFMAFVRAGSLYRNQNPVHRKATITWNAVAAKMPKLGLQTLTVPSFRRPSPRLPWSALTEQFRQDLDNYLQWCAGADVFADDARERVLAPASIETVRNLVLYAVSALVKSGANPAAITSLRDLTEIDAFKRIVRWRHQLAGNHNVANYYIGFSVVRLADEWVKVDAGTLDTLKRLLSKIPRPAGKMSDKNRAMLRQFDDPRVVQRLLSLPERLWSEVRREPNPDWRTLNLAQAAIGIAFLTYMPIRRANLCSLTFDVHLFLRDNPRSTSTLEIPAAETKGDNDIAFDIPSHVSRMLIEYRNRLAPKVIGHRPKVLFTNAKGGPKSKLKVSLLIVRCLMDRAGIRMNVHAFRHLAGKLILDREPGAYEVVKQVLGHKSIETTVQFYTGVDTRRAGRHHHRLIEEALREYGAKPSLRSRSSAPT
jgi:integrase